MGWGIDFGVKMTYNGGQQIETKEIDVRISIGRRNGYATSIDSGLQDSVDPQAEVSGLSL